MLTYYKGVFNLIIFISFHFPQLFKFPSEVPLEGSIIITNTISSSWLWQGTTVSYVFAYLFQIFMFSMIFNFFTSLRENRTK